MRMLTTMSLVTLLLVASIGGAAGPPPKPDPKAEMEAMVRRLSFAPPPGKDAKAELEMLARKVPFFQTGMFLNDTDYSQMPYKVREAYLNVMRPLYSRAYPTASLLPLLRHPNPRVRTLATAGLYAYENPRLLLELVPLLEDRAETFPEVSAPSNFTIYSGWYKMPPMERQQVRDVARRFFDIYLRAAGYREGVAPRKGRPGLADYWARRKGRTYCASWFAVRLMRSSRGYCPSPKDRYAKVRAIRNEIDRLPEVDRALTLLWLWEQTGGDALVSEKELFDLCKKLGPDRLVALLRKKPINTDPDLWTTNGYEHFRQSVNGVIIPRAKELLRKTDADALVECGWYLEAVDLDPERTAALLDKSWKIALDSWAGPRMMLNLERWRRLPEEGTALTVKRFYDEPPLARPDPYEIRAGFLTALGKTWKPRDRQLLVALVRDKRFATIDWHSLETLARLVNRVEKKVVVDPEELKKARQLVGLDENFQLPELMAPFERYPKETPEIKRRLETWRTLLRKALLDP